MASEFTDELVDGSFVGFPGSTVFPYTARDGMGQPLENRGVTPDIAVAMPPRSDDVQLERAVAEAVRLLDAAGGAASDASAPPAALGWKLAPRSTEAAGEGRGWPFGVEPAAARRQSGRR